MINHEAFTDVEKLVTVDLSFNRIKTIHIRNFDGLGEVQELNLQNNQIEQIEDGTFAPLDKLKKLTLSYNVISSIAMGAFSKINVLDELDISNNLLSAIPISLAVLKKLTVLKMDANPIIHVKFTSSNMEKALKYLSISHMPKLEGIEEGAFTHLAALQEIQMHNNPLYDIHPKAFNNAQTTIKTVSVTFSSIYVTIYFSREICKFHNS